jgi:hypothetical protein
MRPINESIYRIAGKLASDGMTVKTYKKADALLALSRTCAPTKLTAIFESNEMAVLQELAKYDKRHNETPKKKDCEWGCVRGYCLSFNANYDESKCQYIKP